MVEVEKKNRKKEMGRQFYSTLNPAAVNNSCMEDYLDNCASIRNRISQIV